MFRSPAFLGTFQVTAHVDSRYGKVAKYDVNDDPNLYLKDRIAWCLYNLTKPVGQFGTFEMSIVIQHLDE